MAQQSQPDNSAPVVEFNSLLSRAQAMVSLYKTQSIPVAKVEQQTKDFQKAWNASKGLVIDELDQMTRDNTSDKFFQPDKGSITYTVCVKGLTVDGKYGPQTGVALALVLWARDGSWEKPLGMPRHIINAIPADPRYWPQQYVANRAMFESLFLPVVLNNPASPPTPPAPVADTPPNLPPATPTPPVPDNAGQTAPVIFDDGSHVQAVTQGKSSLSTVVAVGLGATVLGGIIWFAVRKKGRR